MARPNVLARLRSTARNMLLAAVVAGLAMATYLIANEIDPDLVPLDIFWPFRIGGWIFVAGAAYLSYESAQSLVNPARNRTLVRLAELGEEPLAAVAQLERELDAGPVEEWAGVKFTPNFLYEDVGVAVEIIPVAAVVWAWVEVTKHRKVGMHTHDTAQVHFHLRNEQVHTVDAPSGVADNLVLCVQQRSRGMLTGRDDELYKRWQQSARSLIDSIDRLVAEGRIDQGAGALSALLSTQVDEALARIEGLQQEVGRAADDA